ncbi:MAG TPA: hypothetical protein VL484_08880 [Vicinamibacterales bacterium]|jgi:hypothetical protein|nr:hypothetical protein [Vicinamibacterales bacterium]
MPALPFRDSDIATMLDPSFAAVLDRLGSSASWEAVGAAWAGHRGADAGEGIWASVLSEFTDFLCTDSARYADLRAEWDDLCSRSAAIAVTALIGSLAAELGAAASVVGPLVVWAVLAALRIGTNAFCECKLSLPLRSGRRILSQSL